MATGLSEGCGAVGGTAQVKRQKAKVGWPEKEEGVSPRVYRSRRAPSGPGRTSRSAPARSLKTVYFEFVHKNSSKFLLIKELYKFNMPDHVIRVHIIQGIFGS
jgi:hypothetical protein